jgi:hypothetical protein
MEQRHVQRDGVVALLFVVFAAREVAGSILGVVSFLFRCSTSARATCAGRRAHAAAHAAESCVLLEDNLKQGGIIKLKPVLFTMVWSSG